MKSLIVCIFFCIGLYSCTLQHSAKYNVNGIPQCFLIDKQGKILLKCHHIGEEEIAYIDNILAH